MLENAFRDEGKPFESIVYSAEDPEYSAGVLLWRDGEQPRRLKPNKLDVKELEQRNIIYKMHGSVHPFHEVWDSFVITEEDYVTFLLRMNNAIPGAIREFLSTRSFLFLGYGLKDWNTRVLLRQVRKVEARSWAIQLAPSVFEEVLWDRRQVDLFGMELEEFVNALSALI